MLRVAAFCVAVPNSGVSVDVGELESCGDSERKAEMLFVSQEVMLLVAVNVLLSGGERLGSTLGVKAADLVDGPLTEPRYGIDSEGAEVIDT